jgi:hypothetical protein
VPLVRLPELCQVCRADDGWDGFFSKIWRDGFWPVDCLKDRRYVNPHSTSWVAYEFGIGERSIWFNGKLNIEIRVHEDPSELYGSEGGQRGYVDYGSAGYSP